ncbi:crossover junction endodeoxyribonuclease RuvC [Methanocalculus alkaliphilus]|uniref:crossover junction endodeoxyribonuclease RuvC n=1 Tax=Methanocalculus alkaliphilus TaxID=768730 RepID=UPI00209DAA78|nr:crossover junction endodeoxyribonuclease RuvC [Methanocalculus alkaliphilus]MCP1715955.1 crossover junction endodeoxyribonuclease RuvC [Methanocalculus alkaliphilus]
MIIIGIDPGIARVGYGVIEKGTRSIRHIENGCIETSGTSQTTSHRLHEIYRRISALIEEHAPDEVAVEELFFTKNVTSAIRVAEVRGVILLAIEERGIPVVEYTPNQIKLAVSGSGRAKKEQVQDMVRRLLRLDEIPRPDDAADGLAIALCHTNTLR